MYFLVAACLSALLGFFTLIPAQTATPPQGKPSYNNLVALGYDLLKEGKTKEAYLSAMEAAQADDQRFEAYALAALVLYQQSSFDEAASFAERALARVPQDKRGQLLEIANSIAAARSSAQQKPTVSAEPLVNGRTPQTGCPQPDNQGCGPGRHGWTKSFIVA